MAGYGNGNGNGEELQGSSRQATAREFLAVLFRRKWIVIGLFVATTITILITALSTPTVYISAGSVLVKRGEKESLMSPYRRVIGDWEQDLGSEMEIVRSQPVVARAQAMIDAQGLGDRIHIDAENIDVEVMGKSTVLAVGYVAGDAAVTKPACDAIIRAYIEFRQNDYALAYPREFFEREIEQVESDLRRRIGLRRDFAERSGVVDLKVQNSDLVHQLGTLKQRRNNVRADLAEARAMLANMEQLQSNAKIDLPTFSSTFSNETALIELKRKILNEEARLASLRERFREEAYEVENAKRTIASLKDLLREEVSARLEMSRGKTDQLQARLDVLDTDIAAIEAELAGMPDKEGRLAMMDQEIAILQDRQAQLTESSDQARVNEQTSQSVNVLLLSEASEPRASNARDYVRLALAPAFSVVVGIGLAFFIDGLDLTVRTAGHAERAMELPVLASLTDRRRRTAWKGQGGR